ncbi:hypothetical protein R3P38DRAFT_3257940 [Favolaschia claudopus]|uniref:Uncharacterized protein n=1 Tax=Favolaschia claudopus TaxID=2862362 RepID=A0AAW0D511_9AGAR
MTNETTQLSNERIVRFPRRLPTNNPPPLKGMPLNDRPAPLYALAWVCGYSKLYKNLSVGESELVDSCNHSDVVSKKWRQVRDPDCKYVPRPLPYPGPDGKMYLIAFFNDVDPAANHTSRSMNAANDRVICAAKIAFGVDQDPSLDSTLAWYRLPLTWAYHERMARKKARWVAKGRDITEMDGGFSDSESETEC